MYVLPTSNYLRRNLQMAKHPDRVPEPVVLAHPDRVRSELLDAKLVKVELASMEGRYLHRIIHDGEHIGGAVYGHAKDGMAMLVGTERRVIFLDKKPMFVNKDDVSYNVVSGVSYSHAGFGTTVVLHTKIKDFKLQTLNKKSALRFVKFIETRCLEDDTTERTK